MFHGSLKQLAAVISRDDLPYPRKDIINMVRKGFSAELRTEFDDVTLAQGAKAAVHTHQELEPLRQQVEDLVRNVEQHLPGGQPMEHASTR